MTAPTKALVLTIGIQEMPGERWMAFAEVGGVRIRSKFVQSPYLAVCSLFGGFMESGSDAEMALQMAIEGETLDQYYNSLPAAERLQ